MRRLATATERNEFIEKFHNRNVGRDQYDTPSSLTGCPCDECNRQRKRHGAAPVSRQVYVVETWRVFEPPGKLLGLDPGGTVFDKHSDAESALSDGGEIVPEKTFYFGRI